MRGVLQLGCWMAWIPRLATAYSRFQSISIWVAWIPWFAVGALDFKVWKCTRDAGLDVPFCVDTLFNNVDQSQIAVTPRC